MKKTYHTPKVRYIDFTYDEQVVAASSGVALFGDPQHIGRCQQSSEISCTHFWTAGTNVCEANPYSLRPYIDDK